MSADNTKPKWVSFKWHTTDVQWRARDSGIELTVEQSNEILDQIKRYHDAEIGVNWDVIDANIDMYLADQEKKNASNGN